ncbi:MAG: hypothetical protein ACE5H9_10885 [Anaerolineae bacterium]
MIQPDRRLSPRITLLLLAALSELVYLFVFTLPFPLASLFQTIPPVDYAKLTGHSPGGVVAYLGGVAVLFGLYGWGIRLVSPGQRDREYQAKNLDGKRGILPPPRPPAGGRVFQSSPPAGGTKGGRNPRQPAPLILLPALVFALTLIFAYPALAIDLFIYAIRTRGWALYGLNPLSTPPEALPPGDPWLGLAGEWVDAASPYGPAWEWLSRLTWQAAGGDFLAHLFGLKLIAVLAYLGCAGLIFLILGQLNPAWRGAGTLAFAWNPLVLLETAQNGHNDIVMVFALLAAVWAALGPGARRWGTAPLLALSILVKFVTVLAAPFLLLYLAWGEKRRPRRIAPVLAHGVVLVLLVVLPLLPYWPGLERWAVLEAGRGAGRSLLALLVLALRGLLGVNRAFDAARLILLGGFGLIYLGLLGRLWRGPRLQTALLAAVWAGFFWYVLLAAPVFHGWYLLWSLPLAALLLPQARPLQATVVFSLTALLAVQYFETVRAAYFPVLLHNQLLGHLIGVPLLVLPPALVALGRWRWVCPES